MYAEMFSGLNDDPRRHLGKAFTENMMSSSWFVILPLIVCGALPAAFMGHAYWLHTRWSSVGAK